MRLKPSFRKPRSGCPESITAIAAEPAPAVTTDSRRLAEPVIGPATTAIAAEPAPAVTTDSRRLAEPVIGPATLGRTRWLGPGMTR
jgi:hypothetical protein